MGQTISSALDFSKWEEGSGLKGLGIAQQHLTKALHEQKRFLRDVRTYVLSELKAFPNAPEAAGVYRV